MLKYGLLAVGAATAIAAALVLLPVASNGPRPEPKLLNDPNGTPPSGFVIKPASPPDSPAPAAPPATTPPAITPPATTPSAATAPSAPLPTATDLEALMQKLRASSAQPPPAPVPNATASVTVTAPQDVPSAAPALPPPAVPAAPVVPAPPPAPRWTSVTGQGTRWRMVRAGAGFTVTIDLGNGTAADIRVLPQFGNLDLAATNIRIEYLKQTILNDFGGEPGSYIYARDGSVTAAQ